VRTFADIQIGETLGPVEQFVSKDQCRRYAKVFLMEAPRFVDDEGARKEGLPGMILPGNMSLGILTKFVTDWIGSDGDASLIRMGTTYRVPVQPDHTLTLHGFVTHTTEADKTAEIDVWIENEEGDRLVTGTATVRFTK